MNSNSNPEDYLISIIVWAVLVVTISTFLAVIFTRQLIEILKINGWNRLTTIVTLMISSNLFSICSCVLLTSIILELRANPEPSQNLFVQLGFQSMFLGLQRASFLLSHFFFAYKYWQVSFQVESMLVLDYSYTASKQK